MLIVTSFGAIAVFEQNKTKEKTTEFSISNPCY